MIKPSIVAVLSAILAQPLYDRDLPEPEQRSRLQPWAMAIVAETRNPEEASALVAVATHETYWARYVLEGRCSEGPKGQRCDPDRNGKPLALGPWQLHAWCSEAWAKGPASYREQARCAVRRLRWGRRYCGSWSGALNAYGGRKCTSAWSAPREVTRRKALAVIHRELARAKD